MAFSRDSLPHGHHELDPVQSDDESHDFHYVHDSPRRDLRHFLDSTRLQDHEGDYAHDCDVEPDSTQDHRLD